MLFVFGSVCFFLSDQHGTGQVAAPRVGWLQDTGRRVGWPQDTRHKFPIFVKFSSYVGICFARRQIFAGGTFRAFSSGNLIRIL